MPILHHTITIPDLNGIEREISYEFEYTREETTRDYEGGVYMEPISNITVDGHGVWMNTLEHMFPEITDDQMYDYAFHGNVAPGEKPVLIAELDK